MHNGTLARVLLDRAHSAPDRTGYAYLHEPGSGTHDLTYGALHQLASGMAATLAATGERGDRVLVLSGLGPHFAAAFFGCMLAGRVPVPVAAPRGRSAIGELAAIAVDSGASAIAAPLRSIDDLRPAAAAHPPLAGLHWIAADGADPGAAEHQLPHPDDIAFLQYTSGSTGRPRGVAVKHTSLLHNLAVIRDAFRCAPDTRGVIWLPPHHDMGLIGGLLHPLFLGIPVVLMSPTTLLREPLTWLRAVSEHRGTVSGGPNFAFDHCARRISDEDAAGLDLSSWDVAFVGAEPIDPEVLHRFAGRFASSGFAASSFLPCYGLAESTLFVSGSPHGTGMRTVEIEDGARTRRIVSCGPVQGGAAVVVDPESRTRRADGEIGEIWLSGPSVAAGYWNRPEETAATFTATLDGDQRPHLRTGDLGFVRDGELHVTGRLKELIIVRGRNVVPQDVERSVEAAHPFLRAGGCAAVAVDTADGEQLAVLLEVDERKVPVSLADLEASVRQAVAHDHQLSVHRIVVLRPGQLPRTTSGKLRRLEAKARHVDQHLDQPAPAAADVRSRVAGWAAQRFGLDVSALDPDRPLTALGLDSIKAVELNAYLESEFGYTVSAERLFDGITIAAVVAEIEARQPVAGPRPASPPPARPGAAVEFSLFFFSSDAERAGADKYRLFLDAAGHADRNGFAAVWSPERHFHRFGGLFPNPSVVSAALAATTSRIRIRAGSVVLPLHDPVRTAEEWSVVDNLSAGRVDIAFATGWNPDDFVLAPDRYDNRQQAMLDGVDLVRRLWRGEQVTLPNGQGTETALRIFPAPVQSELPTWITCSGGVERFEQAGRLGANVLTALLFQDADELKAKLDAYRRARAAHGHDPDGGRVTVMLHTFIGTDEARVRSSVEQPFKRYLRDSVDLWRRGSAALDGLSDAEQASVLDFAFERYYRTSALFGTPERASELVAQLAGAGVDEIACLIDFGIADEEVLAGLHHLTTLKDRWAATPEPTPATGNAGTDLGDAVRNRLALLHRNDRGVLQKARDFDLGARLEAAGLMPFYPVLSDSDGATSVHQGRRVVMLGSNNYLGLTADPRVREATAAAALAEGPSVTGSRLMNGSTPAHEDLERKLAHYLGREDALLFTTGYQANLGLLSAFITPGTALVVDEECHASIYDGVSIGGGRLLQFRHNDLADLDRRLADELGALPGMVMVDGVYSMSGDLAPLAELRAICDRHSVPLALDDAHGLGMIGATGRGTEEEFGVIGAADVLTGTFSKSLASVGGWLAGPRNLMDWVRYYGRSMLFSASMPPPAVAAAAAALDVLVAEPERVAKLRELAEYWRRGLRELGFDTGTSRSVIVPVVLRDELLTLRFAQRLLDLGVYTNCVLAPAVAVGRAMLRTTVTAVHEKSHLDAGLEAFATAGRELGVIG
ncbi:MupA/Atu3671 family FMN-dependent luciferase-like monooxygenase [Pseudonocardia sp. TRM90224]|uniref:MupA/Atu3671 family FMN-dependent luciferase-like monooxygenase n=1 Tax=Pseudonocardia sp. TRM90224 TaxID=2812678 RepID=UPI001E599F06|nr:MupA/Atu3671 family FMN-dependent luciferase-like monooxygenase [Pseudonocardia sp. TRM90224]